MPHGAVRSESPPGIPGHPADLLTAWVVVDGMLRVVVVADDRNVTVANRPLAYGSQGYHDPDLALTALGFTRVSEWTSANGADTCRVQRSW